MSGFGCYPVVVDPDHTQSGSRHIFPSLFGESARQPRPYANRRPVLPTQCPPHTRKHSPRTSNGAATRRLRGQEGAAAQGPQQHEQPAEGRRRPHRSLLSPAARHHLRLLSERDWMGEGRRTATVQVSTGDRWTRVGARTVPMHCTAEAIIDRARAFESTTDSEEDLSDDPSCSRRGHGMHINRSPSLL